MRHLIVDLLSRYITVHITQHYTHTILQAIRTHTLFGAISFYICERISFCRYSVVCEPSSISSVSVVMLSAIKNPSKCNNTTFNRFYWCVTFLFILFYFKKLPVCHTFSFLLCFVVVFLFYFASVICLCWEKAILIGLHRHQNKTIFERERKKKNWSTPLGISEDMNIIYLH